MCPRQLFAHRSRNYDELGVFVCIQHWLRSPIHIEWNSTIIPMKEMKAIANKTSFVFVFVFFVFSFAPSEWQNSCKMYILHYTILSMLMKSINTQIQCLRLRQIEKTSCSAIDAASTMHVVLLLDACECRRCDASACAAIVTGFVCLTETEYFVIEHTLPRTSCGGIWTPRSSLIWFG